MLPHSLTVPAVDDDNLTRPKIALMCMCVCAWHGCIRDVSQAGTDDDDEQSVDLMDSPLTSLSVFFFARRFLLQFHKFSCHSPLWFLCRFRASPSRIALDKLCMAAAAFAGGEGGVQ